MKSRTGGFAGSFRMKDSAMRCSTWPSRTGRFRRRQRRTSTNTPSWDSVQGIFARHRHSVRNPAGIRSAGAPRRPAGSNLRGLRHRLGRHGGRADQRGHDLGRVSPVLPSLGGSLRRTRRFCRCRPEKRTVLKRLRSQSGPAAWYRY